MTLAVVCVAAAVFAGPIAEAATRSSAFAVGASIGNRCTMLTMPLSFGSYFPGDTTPLDATGGISLSCTTSIINFIMHVRLSQGQQPAAGSTTSNPQRRMTDGAGNYLSYGIYRNAARTQVWGDTILTAVFPGFGPYPAVVPVYGRIPALQNAQPGGYSDTIVATLFF